MERSLDSALLGGALAGRSGLPTPDELQELMANAEVGLLLRREDIDPVLIQTAWYLHGVASVSQARERYSLARQRQAFLVSAHIFDLALADQERTREDRLSFGFAAAIGYRRGGRDPNATAIMNRLREDIHSESPFVNDFNTFSLEVGVAFLGLDNRVLFRWLANWRREFSALAQESGLSDLSSTAFGPTHLLVLAAEDLLTFLVRGTSERREKAISRFLAVIRNQAGPEDLNARWVAAHLLSFGDEAFTGSLWNPSVVPPHVSSLVREAFTTGSPAIVTLWEPQRDLLTGAQSPFDSNVRRMVLAVPTSGGKTLVAQLLAVEYLARTDRSICYVAPTRSLGREVRQSMASRVRILQKEAGSEQPDFPSIWDFALTFDLPTEPADVEVMTPERLGHLLRHDPNAVVEKFGMFIFDEAQLLKENGRGFALESVIATLDSLTKDKDHQIVLISAAMGNSGAIAQWISPDGNALLHKSDWRGPRRLHAVFNTMANWNSTVIEGGAGSVWRYRHTTELSGIIRVRMANDRTVSLATEGDTGWRLVRKSKDGSQRPAEMKVDPDRSTKQYKIAAEMVSALGHAGSVLVVASTKAQAQALARSLADSCDENPALTPLVDFVRQELGPDHPLVDTLRRGVGFHHAGLPVEVLEALEKAVRDDVLSYLTCTSTLTDGVNLPVRTVILYDQGYPGQPEDSRLRGARLVNAMGRAGRAGKESEGWIVLVRAAEPSEQDFTDLNPDSDELAVMSSLLTDEALASVRALEAELRESEDAIFGAQGAVADFISFVWLMLAIQEEQADPLALDVEKIVDTTLLASQSASGRDIYLDVASATLRTYLSIDRSARLRWPRTGTSIGSAQFIDALALRLVQDVVEGDIEDIGSPATALRLLAPSIRDLLKLPEASQWSFRTTPHGDQIEVEPEDLVREWMSGASLSELAESYLWAAPSATWRIEQMVATATKQFEHYLAWTVGALVDLANVHLEQLGVDEQICPQLAGYIRYGVDSGRSLQLMTSGIRSRRLAHVVEAVMPEEFVSVEDMRGWLSQMTIAEWRDRFNSTSSELLDLVEFTRIRRRSLLRTLLETGTVSIAISLQSFGVFDPNPVLRLRPVDTESVPATLGIYASNELLALVESGDHADTQSILDTGLNIELAIEHTQSLALRITLPPEE